MYIGSTHQSAKGGYGKKTNVMKLRRSMLMLFARSPVGKIVTNAATVPAVHTKIMTCDMALTCTRPNPGGWSCGHIPIQPLIITHLLVNMRLRFIPNPCSPKWLSSRFAPCRSRLRLGLVSLSSGAEVQRPLSTLLLLEVRRRTACLLDL